MTKIEFEVYKSDASSVEGEAKKIMFPKNTAEVRNIISTNEKVTIRGAGTGLAGGAVPQDDVLIDLSKMNKIIEFNKSDETIIVEAGIILDEINNFLDKYGYEFPVKPGSHSVATIGGMIATNAAGERAVKYGNTGKWVEEIEVVNGKAEIVEIKKLDISDFIGLEGISGVITKAKLKLIKKKKRTARLLSFDNLESIESSVDKYARNSDVSEIEFLDRMTSNFIGLPDKYHLIIELENEEGDIKDEAYEKLMLQRDRVFPSLASYGYVRIEDPKIALNRFSEFSKYIESMKVPYYGHLGVGILHPVFKKDDEDKIKSMYNFVKKLKGRVSGEHGIGILKKQFVEENEKKLLLRIKKRHDPFGKLNFNKVLS